MLFPSFDAVSVTACGQVDTDGFATDPNIAGSRNPGELSRPPRFIPTATGRMCMLTGQVGEY
jgi:hypothetical protein